MFFRELEVPLLGMKIESDAWNKLNLILGLLSKRIAFEVPIKIKVSENTLKISDDNTVFKYNFQKLYVFDPTGVSLENKIFKANKKTYTILDDFELSTLGPKRYSLQSISKGNSYLKEMHFYSSDRVDGSDFITDCVVESELDENQIKMFDYSDTAIRFEVERHLQKIGVKGRFMKRYKSGKVKYRKPKVVHARRIIAERDNNIYESTKTVQVINPTLRQIIEESSKR